MNTKINSAKILRSTSSSSHQKTPSKNTSDSSPKPKKHSSSTSVANRLIQKQVSTNRKLEILRQKKLENEMKEVQSKPKILSKSREIARRAEKRRSKDKLLIEVGEEIIEKSRLTVPSRVKSCKQKYEKTFPGDDYGISQIPSAIKKGCVRSQRIKQKDQIFSERIKEMKNNDCNDTFEIEEEIGMIESKLGIQQNIGVSRRNEKDSREIVFSPNPRVNQRLNFKKKFRIREII